MSIRSSFINYFPFLLTNCRNRSRIGQDHSSAPVGVYLAGPAGAMLGTDETVCNVISAALAQVFDFKQHTIYQVSTAAALVQLLY